MFIQSRAEVSTSLSNVGGLAVGAFDLFIYIYKSNGRTHCDYIVGPYPGSLLHFHLGKLQLPREGGTGK